MHTIRITHNLLFEYLCTSGKFIRLPNRIKSKKIDSVARIESKLFFTRIGMLYWYSERRGRTKRLMLRLVARTADQQRHIADQQASIESLIDTQQHLIAQINDTQHKLRDTGMCIADDHGNGIRSQLEWESHGNGNKTRLLADCRLVAFRPTLCCFAARASELDGNGNNRMGIPQLAVYSKHSSSANPTHRSLPFLHRDWLREFTGLFTDRPYFRAYPFFYFLVFCVSTF